MSALLVIHRHPPPSLNTVLAMNRWTRARHAAMWRDEAVAAWANAGRPYYERCIVNITLYARGDRQIQDSDNLYGAAKPILDGLKKRAFPDDSIDVIGTPWIRRETDNKYPRVEIELRERCDHA